MTPVSRKFDCVFPRTTLTRPFATFIQRAAIMSSTDQAFVKAFARRNRNSDHSVKVVTEVTPLPDDEMTLDQKVADSATMWIDSSEGTVARGDAAHHGVSRPNVEPAKSDPPVEMCDPAPMSDPAPQVEQIEQPSLTTSETETVDDIARLVASLQQVHNAFGSIDASSNSSHADVTSDMAWNETAQELINDLDSLEPFAEPKPRQAVDEAPVPFQAAWEVDVFDVPKTVADLFFGENLFQNLSDRMREAIDGGLRTMLITSVNTGEGRSSVAIGMAMSAAASGARVALLDADLDDPTLADDLRLDLEYGWLDTLRSGLSVKEVAVYAVEDAVTLIPLVGVDRKHAATADEVTQVIESLRQRFDLIVIDGPAGNSPSLQPFAATIDSAIIVRDSQRTPPKDVEDFAKRLTQAGVQGVGMVENFIS